MTNQEIKEILGKQLQLLSESSSPTYLDEVTRASLAMVEIAKLLLTPTSDS